MLRFVLHGRFQALGISVRVQHMAVECQSIKAASIVVFLNKSVHLENSRFVLKIVLLFLLRI